MKPLNILHTEASLGWGGQEIRIINESIGMAKRGHNIYIAAPEESMILKKTGGIDMITAFALPLKKKNVSDIVKLVAIIKANKINIINTHSSSDSWIGTFAAKFSSVKPIILRTRHLSTPIGRNPLSRLIYNTLPDAVITTGEEIRKKMIEYNKFDGEKIFSIPTGIDTELFNPKKITASLKPNGFAIGMISVLRSWKGHRYLIETVPSVLKEIPNAIFYIVGDGPQYENLRDMIKQYSLEDKIFMLGHRDDIPQLIASLDIIVHPSHANEGVPQSILQTMAMEKPVIASDVGAIKEVVINGKTGFLIEPKNSKRLGEKVIELYKNPGLRNKFGEAGRKLVERNYSVEAMLDRIESLYERLLPCT
jgi:glycosyltransferase involved in cell wall biosynthesis